MKKLLAAVLVAAMLPASAPVPARAQGQSLDDIFNRVSPTVVVVRSKGRDVTAAGITRFNETGSGVLISGDGRVMTAAHVVNGMDEITVEGIAGEVVRATILSANAAADVALLQLERVTKAMRVARIGDSDGVRVGQQVMIVGAPYGLAYSMSVGWISARWPRNTIFPDMPLAEFLQTTATINTGNSGGPVFNMAGEVIAIVSQNISKSGGSEGLGFVVTIKSAQSLGDLLARDGKGPVAPLQAHVPRHRTLGHRLDEEPGGRGVSEENIEKIRNKLAGTAPGATFKMTVLRAGKVIELTGTSQ